MQPGCRDYYEVVERCYPYTSESGCCLLCSDAEDGCLCFNCKCRQCFWYDPIEKCEYPRNGENEEPEWYIGRIHHETEKAVLCDLFIDEEPVLIIRKTWIPFSILEDDEILYSYIPEWFIENNDLEDEARLYKPKMVQKELSNFLRQSPV